MPHPMWVHVSCKEVTGESNLIGAQLYRHRTEEVRQEVRARGGAIIKIKFARKISDGMLWNV